MAKLYTIAIEGRVLESHEQQGKNMLKWRMVLQCWLYHWIGPYGKLMKIKVIIEIVASHIRHWQGTEVASKFSRLSKNVGPNADLLSLRHGCARTCEANIQAASPKTMSHPRVWKQPRQRKKWSYHFQLLMPAACFTTKSKKGKQKKMFNIFCEHFLFLTRADALTGCELFESEDISCRISDMLLQNSKDPFTASGNTCNGIPKHHRPNYHWLYLSRTICKLDTNNQTQVWNRMHICAYFMQCISF